ncbi:MerR family transcriptional regulator [Nocardiopsis ganjiahuensis]|uniref:MerR family transcriptional regulator n=1 Tax=Nocardiopsis ganjiahuensis TaxID=239984 RepID=UPI0003795D86|nr:MerR family transcriptional regulator [Nocardiopsis ganjiahuensis]
MVLMRVSELAERSGVPASTLRYYEERGLLPAQRSPAGYRLYDQRSVERLAFIGTAKQLGLDLDEIGELTAVWSAHSCSRVRSVLRPRLVERLAEVRERSAELEEFRSVLRDALRRLDALPDRDTPCDPDCAFLADGPDPAPNPAPGPARRVGAPAARPARRARELTVSATPRVSCSLEEDDHRERLDRWRLLLEPARRVRHARGSTWTLPLEKAGALAELAAAEQQCCSFLDLGIDFSARRVHLRVSTGPGDPPAPGSRAEQAARLLGAEPSQPPTPSEEP